MTIHISAHTGGPVTAHDPQEITLDETVAANPEEIDLDDDADADDDGTGSAEQMAEASKQEAAADSGMFQHEELHNFSSIAQPASNLQVSGDANGSAEQSQSVSPALAAIVQGDAGS